MDILPAIDLRDGKVVRLHRGDYDQQTVYAEDPVAIAKQFAEAGARWLHIVDLDAARTGKTTHETVIQEIRKAVDLKIELGGGARDTTTISAMLENLADRVVVGSAALKDWGWFQSVLQDKAIPNQRIALGLDARGGRVSIHGWTEDLAETAVEVAQRVKGSGLGAIVYTDIVRDGTMDGVNVHATAEVIVATSQTVPVIASGGVSSIDDLYSCDSIGCGGVILGKSLYEGRVDLKQAVDLLGN